MAETEETHVRVTDIVNNIKNPPNNPDNGIPQIVNSQSNFVVVTYWWGRNNKNRNTARPCGDFYEDYIKKINKFIVNLLYTAISQVQGSDGASRSDVIDAIFNNLKNDPTKFPSLMAIIQKMIKHYMRKVCDHYNIAEKLQDPCRLLFYKEDDQQDKTVPPPQKTPEQLFTTVYDILIDGILKNKDNLVKLNKIQTEYDSLKGKYVTLKGKLLTDNGKKLPRSDEVLRDDLNEVRRKQAEKTELQTQIIATLKKKHSGISILDTLISALEYKPPIQFEEMIDQWKMDCEKHGCNHLAVEYPEFAEDGGYQLAINAKPKFIQLALKLCAPRGVLYIDGDMNIRSYPGIFDIDNVDYMARGWWMDPRSNWKMTESIMYDPYNFETSGGTMFFSSSTAANKLLQLWITTAENPINAGKADDRVLSLVFNTQSVLTWIRIIQLPVEYLWLSLDYDERMSQNVYDYDIRKMKSTVLIDHPECLTSEDTATGAGASNDRQPKFYEFLEDVYPCVETTHEYILFKTLVEKQRLSNDTLASYIQLSDEAKLLQKGTIKKQISALNTRINNPSTDVVRKAILKTRRDTIKTQQSELLYLPYFYWYYHYMGSVQYLNDGNGDLEDLGFVDPEDPVGEDNLQPLSIISYNDRFGHKPHPGGEGLSVNKIVDINIAFANDSENEEELKSNANVTVDKTNPNLIEIIPKDAKYTTNKSVIQLLLKYLLLNKKVLINPKKSHEYNPLLYNFVTKKVNTLYQDIDFIFYPQLEVTMHRSLFYKPKIFMNQVMLFKPEQRLIDFISMQLSLEDLSLLISGGSYEFMSLVRIAYLNLKQQSFTPSPVFSTSSPNRRTPSPNRRTPSPNRRTPSPNYYTASPNSKTPTNLSRLASGISPNVLRSQNMLNDYSGYFNQLFDMPNRVTSIRALGNMDASAIKHKKRKGNYSNKKRTRTGTKNQSKKRARNPSKKRKTRPNKLSR